MDVTELLRLFERVEVTVELGVLISQPRSVPASCAFAAASSALRVSPHGPDIAKKRLKLHEISGVSELEGMTMPVAAATIASRDRAQVASVRALSTRK